MNRRSFLQATALTGASLAHLLPAGAADAARNAVTERGEWVAKLIRVIESVLSSLAADQLKARMPVEAMKGHETERLAFTHLEALGRTIAGAAPWFAGTAADPAEEKSRARFADLARRGIANAVNPSAADRLDFTAGAQCLVDAAFLALGLSRARAELWDKLDAPARERLVAARQSTRRFKPGRNNWLLFSAMVEAFLATVGAKWQPEPIDVALRSHEEWHKGDGAYGDGPSFHWDYYNSYVIQPFLLQVLDLMEPIDQRWKALRPAMVKRARRYAAIQERLIAPDGSYPPLGRSITYRCGAFHHLGAAALRRELPGDVSPAQTRGALGAVIRRTLDAAGTFDANGWLRTGLCGSQPSLAERYISTGSLYLCTCAFLPLGLGTADEFWSAPSEDWTSRKLWSGADLPADHAI